MAGFTPWVSRRFRSTSVTRGKTNCTLTWNENLPLQILGTKLRPPFVVAFHVVAELVGGQPELGLEADVGVGIFESGCGRFLFWH